MSLNYVDLPTFRVRAGIPDPLDDSPIMYVIGAVSRRLEQHCQRIFYDAGLDPVTGVALGSPATARTYYPDSSGLLRVDDFSTVTGLVVKTDDNDDATFETTWTIGTDFQVEPLNGIRDGVPGWPYDTIRGLGRRSFPSTARPGVQVTARWGWAAVPEPVREATLLQASRLFKRKDSPLGVAGFSDMGAVTRILARLDPDVEFMLQPYVKHPVFCA